MAFRHFKPVAFLLVLLSTSPCPTSAVPPSRAPCARGTTRVGTTALCRPCPAGTFQPYINGTSCLKCPLCTSSPLRGLTRAELCRPCPCAFRRPPGTSVCNPCRTGFVPRSRDAKCIRCAPGMRLLHTGCRKCPRFSVSGRYNAPECTYCREGTTANAARTKCVRTVCAPGFKPFENTGRCRRCYWFVNANGTRSACNDYCPRRLIAPPSSARPYRSGPSSQSRCLTCPAGSFLYALNGFHDLTPACEPCPPGKSTRGVGKAACRNTTGVRKCPRGFFVDADGDCDQCTLMEFRNRVSHRCERCSDGAYGFGGWETECRACLPGQVMQGFQVNRRVCVCGGGSVLKDGKCEQCPSGTYREFDHCRKCDAASFSNTPGSTRCKKCPPNTSSSLADGKACKPLPVCESGYAVRNAEDGCVSLKTGCPSGMQLKDFGEIRSLMQPLCALPGASAPWCPSGTVFNKGDKCIACGEGEYLVDYGMIVICEECYGWSRGGTSSTCGKCPKGHFGRGGTCICGSGGYVNESGECASCSRFVVQPRECHQDSYYSP